MKSKLSIQYTVSRSTLSSISHRLGDILRDAPFLRSLKVFGCTCARRSVFPPMRTNVIRTRTPQWEWIWLSAVLVGFLLVAGVCAGIYLEQRLPREQEMTSNTPVQPESAPRIRKTAAHRSVRQDASHSAPLRASAAVSRF